MSLRVRSAVLCLSLASATFLVVATAEAGGPIRRRGVRLVPAAATALPTSTGRMVVDPNANAPTPMLGTFYSTPFLIARGDFPTGGGYSPLGLYGRNTMSLYGPISAYRATSAPVRVYSRGYDGRLYQAEGTSFSTPFLPEASPVVYPSPNSAYFRPRYSTSPPWFPSGINWVDQN